MSKKPLCLLSIFLMLQISVSTTVSADLFGKKKNKDKEAIDTPDSHDVNLSRDAGNALLSSFSCDGVGDSTKSIISSMGNLRNTVAGLDKTSQDCQNVTNQIDNLPPIKDVISSFTDDSYAVDYSAQEKTINDALANLAIVQKLDPSSTAASLYPTADELNYEISTGQANLVALQSQYNLAARQAKHQKYEEGIQQLNDLGGQIAKIVGTPHECFDKPNNLKQHLMSALVGISGFFMTTPLGIGTTLAGRLLQNVFAAKDAAKANQGDKAFEPMDQELLDLGLSCAMESMGQQYCRVLREKELYSKATEIRSCDTCNAAAAALYTTTEKQNQALQSVAAISNWAATTKVANSNNAQKSQIQTLRIAYNNKAENFRNSLFALGAHLDQDQPDAIPADQKTGLAGNMATGALIFNAPVVQPVLSPDSGAASADDRSLANKFSPTEQSQDFLYFLYGPNSPDAAKMYEGLVADYNKLSKSDTEKSAPASAYVMYTKLMKNDPSNQGDSAKQISALLAKPGAINIIQGNLDALNQRLSPSINYSISDDELGGLLLHFYGGLRDSDSAFKSLNQINDLLKSLPSDFVQQNGSLLDVSHLKKQVATLVTEADMLKKHNFNQYKDGKPVLVSSTDEGGHVIEDVVPDTDGQKKLIQDVNNLVGQNNQLYNKVTSIVEATRSYNVDKVIAQNNGEKDVSNLGNALFVLNKDVLEDTLQFNTNPSVQKTQYDMNASLIATQIKSFQSYFNSGLPKAFNFLDGKTADGKTSFSSDFKSTIPHSLKDDLCIKLLASVDITEEMKSECKDARIRAGTHQTPETQNACKDDSTPKAQDDCDKALARAGNIVIRFKDYMNVKPEEGRACAYQNFLLKENVMRTKQGKRTPSTASN